MNAITGRWGSLADGDQPVRTLWRQPAKVLLARCLEANPLLLIVDERRAAMFPPAPISINCKSVAAQNVAVLMISSDVDEFVGLADRVLVMHQAATAASWRGRR